jgi:hypothetical protein
MALWYEGTTNSERAYEKKDWQSQMQDHAANFVVGQRRVFQLYVVKLAGSQSFAASLSGDVV